MSALPPASATPLARQTRERFVAHMEGILGRLESLATLPALLETGADARGLARQAVALFHGVVMEHHADEEDELFTAVLESAQPGDEAAGGACWTSPCR